jgi:hypothetical protein
MQREKGQDMPAFETSGFLSATRKSVIACKIAPDKMLPTNQKSLLFRHFDHLSDFSYRDRCCDSVSLMLGSIFFLTVIVMALLFARRDADPDNPVLLVRMILAPFGIPSFALIIPTAIAIGKDKSKKVKMEPMCSGNVNLLSERSQYGMEKPLYHRWRNNSESPRKPCLKQRCCRSNDSIMDEISLISMILTVLSRSNVILRENCQQGSNDPKKL